MISRIARVGRIARAGGGAVAFAPNQLSNLIAWFTADPTSCFSDTAATIPCNVGDEVKAWKDRSGTAAIFTQAAAITTTRRMQQDASGKYYVDLGGGANDYLASAAKAAFNGAVGGLVGVAIRPAALVTDPGAVLDFGDDTNMFNQIRLSAGVFQSITVASGTTTNVSNAYSIGADTRLISRIDPVTLQTHRLWKNGSQVATTARTVGMPATNGALTIGSDTSSLARVFAGRVYGIVVYARDLSEADTASIDAYLTGLMP